MRRQIELMVEDGERVDRFIAAQTDLSRAQAQRLIREGEVAVNGVPVKASSHVERGDRVSILLPAERPQELVAWDAPLTIAYEDDDCIVVVKPPGLVVHPATSHRQDTLVNILLFKYPEFRTMACGGTRRPGIVHRLDKDTSGLIVVARHPFARDHLQRQFKRRTVEKAYQTLVHGRLPASGKIEEPIGRDPRYRQRMAVVAGGREAITLYDARQYLVSRYGTAHPFTLADVHLQTGRTHQIRVHMAYMHHPIVGDRVYGRKREPLSCPRQFLHAGHLGFRRPGDDKWVACVAPLPADLCSVLAQLDVAE
jgi:23S rRNA pseudouridine1911/1915/1917 synthase